MKCKLWHKTKAAEICDKKARRGDEAGALLNQTQASVQSTRQLYAL